MIVRRFMNSIQLEIVCVLLLSLQMVFQGSHLFTSRLNWVRMGLTITFFCRSRYLLRLSPFLSFHDDILPWLLLIFHLTFPCSLLASFYFVFIVPFQMSASSPCHHILFYLFLKDRNEIYKQIMKKNMNR